jgi:hypothetical protein
MTQKFQDFYTRCKPQDADIIELVKQKKRVFIGYPAWKQQGYQKWDEETDFSSIDPLDYLYDLTTYDKQTISLPAEYRQKSWKSQVVQNSNLVNDVSPGSYVLIPRARQGVCYIGKVKRYETIGPHLLLAYQKIRAQQGLKTKPVWSHAGDVMQSFLLEEEPKPISLYHFPGPIRRTLFGRRTWGRIQKEHDTLEELYNGDNLRNLQPARTYNEIKKRLTYFLTPEVFEHFMTGLLQLEHPEKYWWQVGGTGDGGADGLVFDRQGNAVGALQCKLKGDGMDKLQSIADEIQKELGEQTHVWIADYYEEGEGRRTTTTTILTCADIVNLFMKHKNKSTYAKMMNVQ